MDFDLWEKVLWYTNCQKYNLVNKSFISDKVFKTKCAEKYVINKFLYAWIDRPDADPFDILDNLIFTYCLWKTDAINYEKNESLVDLYNIYIKTLINIKNYMKKELKL